MASIDIAKEVTHVVPTTLVEANPKLAGYEDT